jgi:hypoxanthine phosphoribosyltransferase
VRDRPAPLEVLYGPEAIALGVRRVAEAIRRDLADRPVFVVAVMNAALYFAADLLRALAQGPRVEGFAAACVASYGAGTAPQGPPRVTAFPPAERLEGRTVLVVDTVVDSGATAQVVLAEARARGAADARLACLVDKPARRRIAVRPDWSAFTGPDRFLVGYGLDAGGALRTLPYVASLLEDPA